MTQNIKVSVFPHIHSGRKTSSIMLDVIIALLPTTLAGIYIFGIRSIAVLSVSVISCVLCEFVFNAIIKKQQTLWDFSAIVTGLLLGLNLPANIALWQVVVGSIFAIIFVKCIFGGLGKNLVNPAITARVFMFISFGSMANAALPRFSVNTTTFATPLAKMKDAGEITPIRDLIVGNHGGAIGEVCAIALIIGGIYLIARRVITWHIPSTYIGFTFVFSYLFSGFDIAFATAQILSGGLLIGAFFMATDYVTCPQTSKGRFIYGIGLALMTVVIRIYGSYPEGVSFAILLMNIVTPFIDMLTHRKLFGGAKHD